MYRRSFTGLLAAALLTSPASSDETRLTGAEIFALLNGNTISGTWVDTAYKSYYATDGVTIYVPEDSPAMRGRWRVNYDTNEYESWWEQSGWSNYTILRTGDGGYAWLFRDTRQPFVVLQGKQVSW